MNNTAIRFGTDGWRGKIADDFTFGNVRRVASATADLFLDQPRPVGRRILIGYDRRFLSESFARTVYAILAAKGLEPWLSDSPLPTPAVSVCLKDRQAAWGLMITASHNPPLYNGFKIKDGLGRSAAPEVTHAIEGRLGSTVVPASLSPEEPRRFKFLPAYERYLRTRLDLRALKRLHGTVVFEYLYGVGAGLPERFFHENGFHSVPLHAQEDPLFGGMHPEPIDPWLRTLQKTVRQKRAITGIALDGDADRLGVVDDLGRTLTPHQVFPLLALHAIEHRGLRGKIVQAVSLGMLGERIAKSFDLPFEEVPVGFKHVAERMVRENVAAGGEESGGYALGGGLPERDGVLNGLLFLEMLAVRGEKPSRLVADMEKRFGRARFKRVDFPVPTPITDKDQFTRDITSRLPNRLLGRPICEVRSSDGVKVVLDSGAWVLLRPSGTEPLLRTYAESESWAKTEALLQWAKKVVKI